MEIYQISAAECAADVRPWAGSESGVFKQSISVQGQAHRVELHLVPGGDGPGYHCERTSEQERIGNSVKALCLLPAEKGKIFEAL